MAVQRVTDLPAWQACMAYKNAVYQLCTRGALSTDWPRRRQLEEAVAGPPEYIAEGSSRSDPADFADFLVLARASLLESLKQLRDAVDTGCLADDVRLQHERLAGTALEEITRLMRSLQPRERRRPAGHRAEGGSAGTDSGSSDGEPRKKNRT